MRQLFLRQSLKDPGVYIAFSDSPYIDGLPVFQVGLKTSVGLTPLHNAASNGHVSVIQVLIQAGAAVNARAGSHATALFIAAQNGHLEV